MTPEERSLLERTHKLTEENNAMLRGMRRISRISNAFRIFYWAVIILIAFGAYYFIQPYATAVFGLYDQVQGNVDSAQQAAESFKDLLK